jgi:hypothetical protein
MLTDVVSMSCYLHFVSYISMLTTFSMVSLHWWRLGSYILPWVCSSVSCIVCDVACSVGGGVGWSISYSIGWSFGCNVCSGIGSSLFSYRLKGTVVMTLLSRGFRLTPGVGTCCHSNVSSASFFNLSGGDADIRLETSYRKSILKLV